MTDINPGLLFIAAAIAVFILVCLVRWGLAVRALAADARAEYAGRLRDRPGSVAGLSEADFTSLYVTSFQPRWALYAAIAAGAALVVTPVALTISGSAYELVWRALGAPEWGGPIGYVYQFSLFFGAIAILAVIAGAVARAYWRRAPEPWTHALARARGEPIPEETGWRRRPKWARRARPDDYEAGDDGDEDSRTDAAR
ncbi:hypothetical protein L2D01_00605 [Hyphomonadaceae bacterium ML37]|nr:hypothetical protein L2D01_00605 [Hyphomonadaceae bacterium ML37]